jgi:bla regulator protein blaR1
MNAISQSDFLQALGWAVMNSLWQMALMWIVYQLLTAVFHLQKPAQRATLASSLLFSGFTWFVFTFLVVLQKTPQAAPYTALANITGNNESLNHWLNTGLPWASMVYLVLLAVPVINFIRNYRYVQHIRQHGIRKADVEWRMFVQKVAGHLGIRKPVRIWMSELVNSPVTIGYLKPVILLPVAVLNQLTTKQVEAILLHELAHIRRTDYLINLLTRLVQTILYFNPFVKAFARIIEGEREKSCDQMVMQFQYEPYGYASALLELEKAAHANMAQSTMAMAAAGGKKSQLITRVETILGIHQKQVFSFHKLAGVLSALVCFIALNALMIMSQPAQNKLATGFLFSQFSGPLVFASQDNTAANAPVVQELPMQILVKAPAPEKVKQADQEVFEANPAIIAEPLVQTKQDNPGASEMPRYTAVADASMHFSQVSNLETIMPELTPQQENQVKEALIASKKVLEETQWKAVEKSIADAMTIAEKEKVKAAYEKAAAEKVDWEKLGDRLKLSYDQIDWDGVNTEFNIAMNNMRLDSLRQVYSLAMTQLSSLEKEMKLNGLKGIPDSDITVDAVQKKIKELQKARVIVQEMRNKKIISL